MTLLLKLCDISPEDRPRVGGKAAALARMAREGLPVPEAICLSVEAYRRFISQTALTGSLQMILGRKDFNEMRWEELWDSALRIRNLFLTTELPEDLAQEIAARLPRQLREDPVVVRSSAPAEDSAGASFAGLHESYVNVRGLASILCHIRLVWASLWSDRALLYRQELGLSIEGSAMAVLIQQLAEGDRSGVAFGISPDREAQGIVEAVWGLNQGLVDGTVEPDRWYIDRRQLTIEHAFAPRREKTLVPAGEGVRAVLLDPDRSARPPLEEPQVRRVFELALGAERLFGSPQDVEWTWRGPAPLLLQARPITTLESAEGDQRPWYLSLRRSFDQLQRLRVEIEDHWLPAMEKEARQLSGVDLDALDDEQLAREFAVRLQALGKWEEIYHRHFIPMAHGIRLFGQVYNDRVKPDDPFEFMDLLGEHDLLALQRNRRLAQLAAKLRAEPSQLAELQRGNPLRAESPLVEELQSFTAEFGDLQLGKPSGTASPPLLRLLAQLADGAPAPRGSKPSDQAERFFSSFPAEQRELAEEILQLGRASYRLRDNDNIFLGKIRAQLRAAVAEARQRLGQKTSPLLAALELDRAEKEAGILRSAAAAHEEPDPGRSPRVQARQIVGQPAGRGIALGPARVILKPLDLADFKKGEVLVCDAVEPNMTFVVPLASAVVERRGGMLIHGAIIAREYGIPCVTGVPEATRRIRTGDLLTIDGYLGIVIIDARLDG